MAKRTEKGKENDITSTKIYEFLRSTPFSRDLFYDIMSDIKEKPTYKHLKVMIENLISKNMDVMTAIPSNDAEIERRKSLVAEICATAFTIDAIFPTMVYNHLQSKFSSLVKDICKEINEEKMNGTISSPESSVKKNSDTISAGSNLESSSKITPSTDSDVKPKRGRKKKKAVTKKPEPVCKDSDEDSIISVGKLSLPSVSSVHTSELSSFDDEISIYSDEGDENEKKKIKLSLTAVQELYQNGKISAWCAENLNSSKSDLRFQSTKDSKNSETVKNNKKENEVSTSNKAASSPTSASNLSFSPQKTLPQRVRKPNSKYSSDNIYCPITQMNQKRKQQVNGTEKKNIADPVMHQPLKEKRKRTMENAELETVNKIQQRASSGDERKDVDVDIKLKTTQNRSSELFKAHSVRSLTSRRTAPVTLYSTGASNHKK